MNHKAIYDRLMERARNRKLTGYAESHHVIPRCMGGGDERENRVRLKPEEHYVAHQLLVFMYPNHSKLVYALLAMSMDFNGRRVNNKLFGWMRRRMGAAVRKAKTGVPRLRETIERIRISKTGKRLSLESIENIRKGLAGRVFTEEHKAALTAAWHKRADKHGMGGKQHSPETKEKMRLAATARKHTPETVAKLTEFAAKQTPEQRSARAHKAWETKRAKAAQLRGETPDGERRKGRKDGGES